MSEVLKISGRKVFKPALQQPSWLQDKKDSVKVIDEMQSSESDMDHMSNYFGLSDLFHYLDNSTEIHETDDYESLDGNCLVEFVDIPIQYGLEKSGLEENIHIQSIRFQDDIIFTLNNSKLFEVGALTIASGMFTSLALLPDGFNISAALLLSAPLLVCICGLFVKHLKKSTSITSVV